MWEKNNKVLKSIFSIALLVSLSLILFLILSKPKPQYKEKVVSTLGTIIKIYISGEKVSTDTLLDISEKELQRLNQKFSANVEGSVVYRLNKNDEVECDEEALFLFQAALNTAKISGDAFDPTIRPLMKLWGFDDANSTKQVPSNEAIKTTLKYVNYRYVKIDQKKNKVYLLKKGVEIDLGGIAKGYAVDKVIERIKGIDPNATGFIDAGGDIGIIGPKYGNLPWAIGIRDPFKKGMYSSIGTLYLYSGAVATSGNYERFFIKDGVRYHHLIDPKTGYPSNKAVSSTVIAKKVMTADAFATTLFILGYDNPSLEYFTNFGIQAYIISPTGEGTKTSGFDYFMEKER